ncbi:serine hydrolase domain-containing protein [Syntrophomonas wolfei]|uniref:serine hydrolase domain-containing protein n=1 Tax=Syntrophomonas wolfei TaxID=863 RepID=UPI0023F34F27|nr:serine hydrolase domain-containing protein [Syntrophomonas wolfei]
MNKFRVVAACLIALLLAIMIPASFNAAENPALSNTRLTARSEIWKAINAGNAGSGTVAVMENGKIVYAEGFGMADRERSISVDKNTLFNIGSISKVYCATAIMLLVDEGKVELDQPVTAYLPEFTMEDERYKDITVRMLLNHSSGLPGTIGSNSFGFEYHKEYYQDVLDTLAKSHLKHRPGEMAPYCNDGFTLAEMIVARISGKSYLQFLSERVFEPLGLNHTGPGVGQRQGLKEGSVARYYTTDGKSEPLEVVSLLGSGGLSATPEDLCKFADTFSASGPQILSPASLAEMRKGQPAESYMQLKQPELSFGLGWDLTEIAHYKAKGINVLGKSGGTGNYSSMLYTIPDKRISVAVIFTGPQSNAMVIAASIMEAFLCENGLFDKTPAVLKLPLKAQSLPSELANYEGYYSNGSVLKRLKVDRAENKLTVYMLEGGQETEILSAIYNDGYFHNQRDKYYFITLAGRQYFVQHSATLAVDMIASQKLEPVAKASELKISVDKRKWLRRNAKAYEARMLVSGHIITSRQFSELPGYIDFDGIKRVISPTSAGMAINSMRDLTELRLSEKDGISWAWISGMLYTPADAVQSLASGDTNITTGREGYNEWRKVAEDSILDFQIPNKGRVIVFDPDGQAIYDSAVDSGEVLATTGSFVEVAGDPGATFKLSASSPL